MKKLGKKVSFSRETVEAFMPVCRCFCYCDTLDVKYDERAIDSGDVYSMTSPY